MHKCEVVEAMSIVETPPMMAVGVVGYVETLRSLHTLTTVWASHLSDEVKRRFYKNWYLSVSANVALSSVFLRTHRFAGPVSPHLMEIQVNGGSIADKVEFAHGRVWIPPRRPAVPHLYVQAARRGVGEFGCPYIPPPS
jgi:large subunit ribosomal protein L3e